MNTKTKSIAICLLLALGILNSLEAQKVEIDFGIGVHDSNIRFHHTSDVDSDNYSDIFDNSNFNLGISSRIGKKNWYLRSEFGFIKTNSFLSISYNYNEGFGEQFTSKVTYLTNQKIYLGILPEYRYIYKSLLLKFAGGVLFSSDIVNTYLPSNTVLLTNSGHLGLKMGGAAQYMWDNIGVELRMSYARIGPSKLENRWHPKVSYDLLLSTLAIVYSL